MPHTVYMLQGLAGLPSSVISRAEEIQEQLEQRSENAGKPVQKEKRKQPEDHLGAELFLQERAC